MSTACGGGLNPDLFGRHKWMTPYFQGPFSIEK